MADEPMGEKQGSSASSEVSPLVLAGLGAQFFVALLLFVYAGNWMDARWHTSPLFVLAGVFVGGGGSFYTNYRRLMRRINESEVRRSASSEQRPKS